MRLIRPLFRRHRLRIAAGFAALGLVDLVQLYIPRIMKQVIDGLARGTATEAGLIRAGGAIFGLALAIALLRFGWRYLVLGFSRMLERDLRDRMFLHLLGMDRTFFGRRSTGDIMALSTNDLASVQLSCGMGLVACVDAVFMSIAAILFMAALNWRLTAIAVAPMPVLAVLTRILARRLHRRFRKVQEQFARITEFARSTIASIRLIQAYTQEAYQAAQFDRMGREYVEDNIRLAVIQGTLFPFSGLIANTSLLLVLFFGGRLAVGGIITVGDLTAFIAYLYLLTWPMMALGWVVNLFQRGATSLQRIEGLLEERTDIEEPAGAIQLDRVVGTIAVQGLSFTYPRARAPALDRLQLDLQPGTTTGLVGRTGCGKSTLCHLLARFYPVPDGTLLVDGRDVNRLTLDSVRNAVALVPQEVVLFSDTIAANIAFGRPRADLDAIASVARVAAIDDEILAMPDGYETRIGERGVKLSGGQRQRLAIARALLLERPILIIDDGLSAVDLETEHAIIHNIRHFLRGRTCLIVSHRVAPLADADTILVMANGRIVDRGDHARLIERNAYYAGIYRHQVGASRESGGNGGKAKMEKRK
ncbi:MAG: multidrug ABC transporter ATP-binding protein [Syntrophobacteraceae bacterium CG2_30_61_12]|nr:MAG: multidrug ABC transporter ATP-binding protein [Syntrophobacteraceae bacterium CG2_30_61_12]